MINMVEKYDMGGEKVLVQCKNCGIMTHLLIDEMCQECYEKNK